MRKKILVGNWKMNKTIAETKEFINQVDGELAKALENGIIVGIAPSFLSLKEAVSNAKNLIVAAQNCHFEKSGAFTGEVSIPMLEEIGVKYCIVGHSEEDNILMKQI